MHEQPQIDFMHVPPTEIKIKTTADSESGGGSNV